MSFPFYRQLNSMDCGPTCLRMIAKHYGKNYHADTLREKTGFGKQGVSLLGISDTAEKLGFRTRGVQIDYAMLMQAPLPAILHWNQNHFLVLVSLSKKGATVADPAMGIMSYQKAEFQQYWSATRSDNNEKIGTVLLLEPSPSFYDAEDEKVNRLNWGTVLQYLRPARPQLFQVFLSLILTSLLSLILPFLTQSMVDIGINTSNIQYITLVLIAQMVLVFSTTVVGFLRSRIQMRLSNTINISILSDFWIKLTRLPVSYYDTHHTGDTLQRINDNRKIQAFLTGQTMSTLFSIFNFFIFAFVLVLYNIQLFLVFAAGNLLYFGWIRMFLRVRRKINYERFYLSTRENNATLQLVQGMQEIRLNNAETRKRWEWENIQANVFKVDLKNLNYEQWQSAGALFITQGKDILISFMVANLVVQGQLTFGAMLAVQYIIGQLSGPVSQLIGLAQSLQDARISMERLNEIHEMEDEEPAEKTFVSELPQDKSIELSKLSFTYPGAGDTPVLKNIHLRIPEGKVTAIVGASGSGKTTILKLLLKVYEQYDGEIRVGGSHFRHISPSFWRSKCGAVLQDGFIFHDTIARNIAVGDEYVDHDKLLQSCRTANILSFIETLPNGFNTRLGTDGMGMSQGQRQRLLIARAVYKSPEYLFFDEATNALDSSTEKTIVENLTSFFEGRTVIIVAHRLSTVRNADNIIVIHEGRIAEQGTHEALTATGGRYYHLVKNQLELGA